MGKNQAVSVVEVPMVGVDLGGVRRCMFCGAVIQSGETWRKIQRAGRGGYAVGVHDACWSIHVTDGIERGAHQG